MTRFFSAFLAVVIVLAPSLGTAHPHFNKTITCQLPGGAEAVITYNTTPANEQNAEKAAVGTFVTPRRPSLKLSAEVTAGGVKIPAGEYTIGAVKTSATEWTMALYKGGLARGAEPDMAQVLKLESAYSASAGTALATTSRRRSTSASTRLTKNDATDSRPSRPPPRRRRSSTPSRKASMTAR